MKLQLRVVTPAAFNMLKMKTGILLVGGDPRYSHPVRVNTLQFNKCTLFTRRTTVPEQICRRILFEECRGVVEGKRCCACDKCSRNTEGEQGGFFFFLDRSADSTDRASSVQPLRSVGAQDVWAHRATVQTSKQFNKQAEERREEGGWGDKICIC